MPASGSQLLIEGPVALLPLIVMLPWLGLRGRRHRLPRAQLFGQLALATYVAVLIGLTFFPIRVPPWPGPGEGMIDLNLRPLRTIGPALELGPGSTQFRLLAGNILAFVPLGLLLPVVRPRRPSLAGTAAIVLAATLAVEGGQLLVSVLIGGAYRSSDVDDVLLNLVGGLLGYAAWRAIFAPARPNLGAPAQASRDGAGQPHPNEKPNDPDHQARQHRSPAKGCEQRADRQDGAGQPERETEDGGLHGSAR